MIKDEPVSRNAMQIFAVAIVTEVSRIYGSASSSSNEVLSCFFKDAAGSV